MHAPACGRGTRRVAEGVPAVTYRSEGDGRRNLGVFWREKNSRDWEEKNGNEKRVRIF